MKFCEHFQKYASSPSVRINASTKVNSQRRNNMIDSFIGSKFSRSSTWITLIALIMLGELQANNLSEPEKLNYFATAYEAYPNIPRGYLEAMAFVNTRWTHLAPEYGGHSERPQTAGIMGLHLGDYGYQNQVEIAALLLGVKPVEVITNPQTNIMATAALISHLMKRNHLKPATLEDMRQVTDDMLGRPEHLKSGEVADFIAASQFYDLLLTIDRGQDDHDVFILDQPINWSRAFSIETLGKLQAPTIRLNIEDDRISLPDITINKQSEIYQTVKNRNHNRSTDYGPANWLASPYHSTRTQSIQAVTIHTTQGSYAGTLNWFQNNPYSVSAHYVIRSSDGQVTQMVRNYRRAHHVGIHNSSTLGIEHEGFVDNAAWYTTAMYNASAKLTKHLCQKHAIDCSKTYSGPAHSGVTLLPNSIKVKGHQHFSSQNHTDPGIHWDWNKYYALINGGAPSANTVLDNFEQSEGRFNTSPTYSGSTQGISSQSFAERTSSIKRNGNYSEHIQLKDNPNSSTAWAVRFLSASGSVNNNPKLNKAGGRIGFWVLAAGSGMQVAVSVDDNDGTERSDKINLPANQWTYVEWMLDSAAQWNPWYNGNGVLGNQVSLDAIWLFRAQTNYTVNVYIDDVQYRSE